jgi:hypothetical protein
MLLKTMKQERATAGTRFRKHHLLLNEKEKGE